MNLKHKVFKLTKKFNDPFLFFSSNKPKDFDNPIKKRIKTFKLINNLISRLKINIPQKTKIIHVIGSSGKGTTSLMLYQLLKQHGYKVAVYAKPHIYNVLERFTISYNTHLNLYKLSRIYIKILRNLKRSEYLTYPARVFLTAIWYFSKLDLNFIIIESGIGAKYDYTDIFRKHKNYYNIITNIKNLHKKVLGYTLKDRLKNKLFLTKYTKKSFLLSNYNNLNLNLYDKIRIINPNKFSYKNSILGSEINCYNQKIYTNLLAPVHLKTLCKLQKVLEYLIPNKQVNKNKVHKNSKILITLPARNQPIILNPKNANTKLPVILDNSHSTDQIKELFCSLKCLKKYTNSINFLIASSNAKIINFFNKISKLAPPKFPGNDDTYNCNIKKKFKQINISWLDIQKLGPHKNFGYKIFKQTNHKSYQTSNNTINIITGSVYLPQIFAKKEKIKLKFISKKAVKQSIKYQKQFARILIKSKLKHFYTTKHFTKQSVQISNTIENFIINNSFQKIAIFIPIKKREPLINIQKILSILKKYKIQVFVPVKIKDYWYIGEIKHKYIDYFIMGNNLLNPLNLYKQYFAKFYNNFLQANFTKNSLILLPGLAFDKFGNRLGHGKGIYDKLLKGLDYYFIPWYKLTDKKQFTTQIINTQPLIMGIAFKWQFFEFIVN